MKPRMKPARFGVAVLIAVPIVGLVSHPAIHHDLRPHWLARGRPAAPRPARCAGWCGGTSVVVGDAVVVSVREDSATIRVEHATDVIEFGDWAAPQRVVAVPTSSSR